MSLINKMLVDLEARKDGAAIVHPIYDDLRPAAGNAGATAFARYRLAIVAAGAGAILVVAYAMYTSQAVAPAPVTAVVAKPAPRATVDAPAPAPSAPASTSAQAITESSVATASVAPPVVPAASAPVLATIAPVAPVTAAKPEQPDMPATVVAVPKPETVIATPTPIVPAVSAKPATVARARPAASKRPPSAAPTDVQAETKIEKTARALTPRDRALDLHRTALAQRKRGDFGAAEASLRAALVQDAGLIPARMALVNMQLESGRSSEAIALLQDGLSRAPAHYAFAQLAARLYVEQGNEAHALATLEANRVHAARDADYLGFLATLYQRAQRYADAAAAYDAALALRPQEAKWWVGSGIVREAQGDWVGAESAYARAQSNPALPAALTRFVHERLSALKARS